jgi:hypothetical protein
MVSVCAKHLEASCLCRGKLTCRQFPASQPYESVKIA